MTLTQQLTANIRQAHLQAQTMHWLSHLAQVSAAALSSTARSTPGSNFAGGELGHTVIVVDGRPCTCGRHGCWETYASATGLIKTTKEHMKDAPKDSPIWTIVDGDESKVNGRTAFDAMRAGDPVGKAVVDEYIKYLSVGLTDMINIFQPAILCIGGGICNEGETLLAPVRAFIDREQYAMNSAKKTKVCKAQLGNDAGIIGAALLGKQED